MISNSKLMMTLALTCFLIFSIVSTKKLSKLRTRGIDKDILVCWNNESDHNPQENETKSCFTAAYSKKCSNPPAQSKRLACVFNCYDVDKTNDTEQFKKCIKSCKEQNQAECVEKEN